MYLYLSVATCIFSLLYFFHKKRSISLSNAHFLITGGSSGIGLALALQVARNGGNISIIARSKNRLAEAKEQIMAAVKNPEQKVFTYSMDVSKQNEETNTIVRQAEEEGGPITTLVNCAGTSVCFPFLETTSEDFSKMMDVNYFGSVHVTRAVLPYMIKRKNGSIVFVSSIAGIFGIYGYTAYSASKFALLGFAESLQMEVKPHNISITVAFPPDTDTPGFAEEMKNKPIETVQISETSGLTSADQVASSILRDSLNKKFMSCFGIDGLLLTTVCSGMTPVKSLFELIFQVLTMGIFRLVGVLILLHCGRIVKKCAEEKQKGAGKSVYAQTSKDS